MIRVVLVVILLASFYSRSGVENSYVLKSFSELVMDKSLSNSKVEVKGFLYHDDSHGIILCQNIEVCMTIGKERLMVVVNETHKNYQEMKQMLNAGKNCHITLAGRFNRLDDVSYNYGAFIGSINLDLIPMLLAKPEYLDIFSICKMGKNIQ